MHRRRKHLCIVAVSIFASVWLSGCSATSVAAGKYVRNDDTSQTLTLQSKPSRLFHLTGRFTGKLGGGTYSLKNASGTAEGTLSYVIEGKDSAEFALKVQRRHLLVSEGKRLRGARGSRWAYLENGRGVLGKGLVASVDQILI
jgi:hypothetical protein